MYRVTVSPEVAKLQPNDDGRRRRPVKTEAGPRLLEFSRLPTYLDILPPEVEEDPFLQVKEVPDKEAKDGTVILLKAKGVEDSASPTPEPAQKTPARKRSRSDKS